MKVSLLVVNYRSAELTNEAVRTARAASRVPLQVVVVDNSADDAEAARVRDSDTLIVSKTNRGYAGGINLGRAACTGDVIVISNPDVTFDAECIDRLVDAGASVSGPALYWDSAYRWHLPPAELVTASEKLDEVLASRARISAAQRDRRRFLRRVAFWSLTETTPVRALSGAVMAVHAADFDAAGGFDERFALYFEENDFLRRLAAMRKRIAYVPAARARHLFNQSAGQVAAESAARYAESELRYLEKWNGPWLARTMKRLERPMFQVPPRPAERGEGGRRPGEGSILEASPLENFNTAAGCFGCDDLPDEIRTTYRGEVLYLRTVDLATGRVSAQRKMTR